MYWTGKGDDGRTKLFNSPAGCRIPKSSRIVEALGSLDEVNSYLGLAKALSREQKLDLESFVNFLQEQIFILQAELAGAEKTVSRESLEKMESQLHVFSEKIPPIIGGIFSEKTWSWDSIFSSDSRETVFSAPASSACNIKICSCKKFTKDSKSNFCSLESAFASPK